MAANTLDALGVLGNEDAISNLLAYCVNTSQSFGAAFVSALLGAKSVGYDEVRAYPRLRVMGSGIPDLVLKARAGGRCYLVVIENKLTAEEGDRQTERYAGTECVRLLQDRLRKSPPLGEWYATHYAFVTLYPWQKPRNPQFRHVTYEQLLSVLTLHGRMQEPLAARLFRDLSDAYLAFYAGGHIQPNDLVVEKLSSSGNLDSAFLYFGSLFGGLAYPAGLRAERIDRTSRMGRLYYLALISKDRWHPPAMPGTPGFNIHLEPQFNGLARRFSLFLHYEIRDYRPRAQAIKDFGGELHEYERVRQQFIDHLADSRFPDIELAGRSNQVGKIRVEMDGGTRLRAFSDAVLSSIGRTAEVIDRFPGLP